MVLKKKKEKKKKSAIDVVASSYIYDMRHVISTKKFEIKCCQCCHYFTSDEYIMLTKRNRILVMGSIVVLFSRKSFRFLYRCTQRSQPLYPMSLTNKWFSRENLIYNTNIEQKLSINFRFIIYSKYLRKRQASRDIHKITVYFSYV